MADAATMTLKAVILPDEIQKTLTNLSFVYTPTDANDGWYYGLVDVLTSSQNLIPAGTNFLQLGGTSAGEDTGSAMHTITAADKVKFLFIKHSGYRDDGTTANTADSVYLTFDGGAVTSTLIDAFEIGPSESWYCKPFCTVDDLRSISGVKNKGGGGGNKIQCLVAALIDNV
jgi:hypothetical protein